MLPGRQRGQRGRRVQVGGQAEVDQVHLPVAEQHLERVVALYTGKILDAARLAEIALHLPPVPRQLLRVPGEDRRYLRPFHLLERLIVCHPHKADPGYPHSDHPSLLLDRAKSQRKR